MSVNLEARRSTASVALLCQFGEESGMTRAACLRDTGLHDAQLADPVAEISAVQELQLVRNLVGHLGSGPGPGVLAGQRYHLTSYGIWGFGLVSSPSLRSAVELGITYLDLTFAFARIWLEESHGEARLRLDGSHLPDDVRVFLLERDAAAIATLQRELFDMPLPQRRVTFRHSAPADRAAYQQCFRVMPVFDAPLDMAAFDAALLDLPLPQANSHTRRLCEMQCRELLARRRARAGVAGQVRELLLADPRKMPDMEQVATALHVSSRTLRRQLAEQDTSYRALVDEVRQALAEEMLRAGGFGTEEIAARLGYAEVASFIHAFRRWTGCTPGAFARQAHTQAEQRRRGVT